jgi:hypothetical protein
MRCRRGVLRSARGSVGCRRCAGVGAKRAEVARLDFAHNVLAGVAPSPPTSPAPCAPSRSAGTQPRHSATGGGSSVLGSQIADQLRAQAAQTGVLTRFQTAVHAATRPGPSVHLDEAAVTAAMQDSANRFRGGHHPTERNSSMLASGAVLSAGVAAPAISLAHDDAAAPRSWELTVVGVDWGALSAEDVFASYAADDAGPLGSERDGFAWSRALIAALGRQPKADRNHDLGMLLELHRLKPPAGGLTTGLCELLLHLYEAHAFEKLVSSADGGSSKTDAHSLEATWEALQADKTRAGLAVPIPALRKIADARLLSNRYSSLFRTALDRTRRSPALSSDRRVVLTYLLLDKQQEVLRINRALWAETETELLGSRLLEEFQFLTTDAVQPLLPERWLAAVSTTVADAEHGRPRPSDSLSCLL